MKNTIIALMLFIYNSNSFCQVHKYKCHFYTFDNADNKTEFLSDTILFVFKNDKISMYPYASKSENFDIIKKLSEGKDDSGIDYSTFQLVDDEGGECIGRESYIGGQIILLIISYSNVKYMYTLVPD